MGQQASEQHRQAQITSPLGRDTLLLKEMHAEEGISKLFTYHIVALSTREDIELDELLGEAVTVTLETSTGTPRHFNGLVSQFIYTGIEGDYAVYEITLKPFLWFLHQNADCRIFQHQNTPTLIQTLLCDEHGFTHVDNRLSGQYTPREYCVQYRESLFHFISRLMEQEGIYYYFEHTHTQHTLVLADGYGAHAPFPGFETVPLYLAQGSGRPKSDALHSWRAEKQLCTTRFCMTDYDFTKPKSDLAVQRSISQSHTLNNQEIYDYPGLYTEISEGEEYAQHAIEAAQTPYEQMSGTGQIRGMIPGYLFTLSNSPRMPLNQEYLILTVQHHFDQSGYASGDHTDTNYSTHITAMPASARYKAPRTTPKPTIQGQQTAVVVGAEGEEIYTDEFGRIKVQFHWDRLGHQDQDSSCWIRVAQQWAGKGWGFQFIPRMGQEVIVSFLEGDPDRPIITGSTYNADNQPPYTLPANKTHSGIKSRSTLDGTPEQFNEIRFEDKKGEERLHLHAEKDQTIEVENDETHWVGHDRSKTVDHDEQVTILNNRSEHVGNNELISIGNDRTEDVANNESLSIGKNRTLTIGDNRTTQVGKDEQLDVGKTLTINVADQIVIKTGSASITMKKNGDITIKGKNITLQGSGGITQKASQDVVIKGSKILQN